MQPNDIGEQAVTAVTGRLRGSLLKFEQVPERAITPGAVIIRRDDGKPYHIHSINTRGLVHLTDTEGKARITLELDDLRQKLNKNGSAWHWP